MKIYEKEAILFLHSNKLVEFLKGNIPFNFVAFSLCLVSKNQCQEQNQIVFFLWLTQIFNLGAFQCLIITQEVSLVNDFYWFQLPLQTMKIL